jgi:hypothetical protein
MDHLLDVLRDFVHVFERLGIPYALMGGLAVRVYGIPRATYDIDFTIGLVEQDLDKLRAEATGRGYSIPEAGAWMDRVAGMPLVKFHLFSRERVIDIDLFLAKCPFQHSLLQRRRREKIDGLELALVTPEDLILLKLLASRPRDLADIGDVLFTQGQLDEAYLRTWADQLHVRDALEAALARFRS